jgi:hypothetical protein
MSHIDLSDDRFRSGEDKSQRCGRSAIGGRGERDASQHPHYVERCFRFLHAEIFPFFPE